MARDPQHVGEASPPMHGHTQPFTHSAQTHSHTHTHTRARRHTCTRTRSYTHAPVHACTHTHSLTYAHAHEHVFICVHTCTQAHTFTHRLPAFLPFLLPHWLSIPPVHQNHWEAFVNPDFPPESLHQGAAWSPARARSYSNPWLGPPALTVGGLGVQGLPGPPGHTRTLPGSRSRLPEPPPRAPWWV